MGVRELHARLLGAEYDTLMEFEGEWNKLSDEQRRNVICEYLEKIVDIFTTKFKG